MRRRVALLAAMGLVAGLLGIAPAQAQDQPVGIIIFQGTGWVCGSGGSQLSSGEWTRLQGHPDPPPTRMPRWDPGQPTDSEYGPMLSATGGAVNAGGCQSWEDQIWAAAKNVVTGRGSTAGLWAPGMGPPMVGPYRLSVGAGLPDPAGVIDADSSACVTNIVDPSNPDPTQCNIESYGWLTPGLSATGAHAFSSKGRGWSEATALQTGAVTTAYLAWQQSAATILPLIGQGNATGTGPVAVIGFTSSRSGGEGTGNAGLSPVDPQPTSGFVTEGMTVSFPLPPGWPGASDPLR